MLVLTQFGEGVVGLSNEFHNFGAELEKIV